eukprot:CAMPEP_0182873222 /NCGR_PEP_ID=MMETSP0034_2-20130328/12196_1 /TAXON_ID=156128 /ORGANISM="Nephroselmis pyriformis, Strain CCMP717" /LENGTH=227 /DNA_ID=CAMNT_0025005857 /DNA_START=14 /DNA_END=693 /DNA_ORIENTATION=+
MALAAFSAHPPAPCCPRSARPRTARAAPCRCVVQPGARSAAVAASAAHRPSPASHGRRLALLGGLGAGLSLGAWLSDWARAEGTPSIEALRDTIRRDFEEGQYYVTGKLTPEIFEPDCAFIDPTTNVKSVAKYTAAVASLFDAAESRADLISIEIVDEAHIKLRWRLEGVLRIPVKAPIKPYTGTTIYTVGPSGKIVSHFETWDISALDAVVSTFVPSFGAPPAPPV